MKPGAWVSALLSLSVLCAEGAHAATLTISPVSVILEPGTTSGLIEVKNLEPDSITVQARIYAWSQVGDDDELAPTSDIILSPPIATIPAGSSQTLRLLLRPGAKVDTERHYRVLLDEIPAAGAGPARVSFAMRSSIPVFVMRSKPSPPKLAWDAARDGNGAIVISATNSAANYDRIFELAAILNDGSARSGVLRGTNGYVLPHVQRRWTVSGELGPGPIRFTVTTRTGKSEHSLPIRP